MKHNTLLLVFVVLPLTLFAQSTASDYYKQQMVEYVNNGYYERAAKVMPYVEDWSFDSDDEKAWLKEDNALAFLHYADSMHVAISLCDSLRLYIVGEACSLGTTSYSQGEYNNAIDYISLAADLQKKVNGEQHPAYATSLNNLGVLYDDMGDYGKAERYYLESLSIKKSVYGEQHPAYTTSLNNLCSLYDKMGDYVKAEPYYLEALEIQKSVLGELHPDYAESLMNLGDLYCYDMGDYGKAEQYYLEALAIWKSVYGEQHP
ncbi:MAG: tetratricopeptide repeat protein, partial [Paludibacteraceae bacterium]